MFTFIQQFLLASLLVGRVLAIDQLKYVEPLIGSGSDGIYARCSHIGQEFDRLTGHSFPGATIPYGMAKAGADTDAEDNQGGFKSDDPSVHVTGFSSMHDSVRSLSTSH